MAGCSTSGYDKGPVQRVGAALRRCARHCRRCAVPGHAFRGPCAANHQHGHRRQRTVGVPHRHPASIPPVDQGTAALMADLRLRGLLDTTLVIWMGEFGRTPRINLTAGRDHYPQAFNLALAGAGVQGGQVIGATDRARRRGGRAAGDGAGPVLHLLPGAGHRPARGEPEQRRPAAARSSRAGRPSKKCSEPQMTQRHR